MATESPSKIKQLYSQVRPGQPVTAAALAALGISGDLVTYYVRAGWLLRLVRGVYRRPDGDLALHPSLVTLEGMHPGLHVGGKSALDWHGVRHFVSQRSRLQLFGSRSGRLPAWFTTPFPASYHRKRLFDETPDALLAVRRWQDAADMPRVSDPERAWLEVLSEVGVRQPLSEARELAASTHTLRARVLDMLLRRCVSVKTVRLCLTLGRDSEAPWMRKLDLTALPTGSDAPWVGRTREGLLVLPP